MSQNNAASYEEIKAREDVSQLLNKWNLSWTELIDRFHKKINDLKCTHVRPITYAKGWQKIFDGTGGKRKNIFWWKELYLITQDIIKKDIGSLPNDGKSIIEGVTNNRKQLTEKIKYGYFINPDTIIPRFFEYSYKEYFPNIEFIPFYDWNVGLKAFIDGKVDVALRDFPTTVAFNAHLNSNSPLFFWPFLSFYGYGIFIKNSAIKKFVIANGLNRQSFKDFTPTEKTIFLEEQNYIVERNSDFEWVIKRFCTNNSCNMTIIEQKITNCNTNIGKTEFINNKNLTIYCTNPGHIIDLEKRKLYELIPQSTINHKNYNGLICKEEYYKKWPDVIKRLIKVWFYNIVPFNNEIRILAHPPAHRPIDYSPSYMVKNLTSTLNEETNSKITLDDLPVLYEHSNNFYENAGAAFKEFYDNVLLDPLAIQNYSEIAHIQLGSANNDIEKLKSVISSIRNNMLKL